DLSVVRYRPGSIVRVLPAMRTLARARTPLPRADRARYARAGGAGPSGAGRVRTVQLAAYVRAFSNRPLPVRAFSNRPLQTSASAADGDRMQSSGRTSSRNPLNEGARSLRPPSVTWRYSTDATSSGR